MRTTLMAAGLTEEEASVYTTHSMKRTILDWCASSGAFTYEERRCIGHHMHGLKSKLTYSQEEMTRLMGKILRLITAIRMGQFDPDARGASRVKLDTQDIFSDDSESEESDVEELTPEIHRKLQNDKKESDEVIPVIFCRESCITRLQKRL